MDALDREDILRGLRRIDQKAREAGVTVDLAIYGGAALSISFDMRTTTRDVDAVVQGDPTFLRRAAKEIAQEEHWSEDWLNDGVKGFVSSHEQLTLMEWFQAAPGSGLRIHVPTPEYLFAMKCMAMRSEIDGSHDRTDIEELAVQAGIKTTAEALALVESFYPRSQIPAKVVFGVEEIMEQLRARADALAVAPLDKVLADGKFDVQTLRPDHRYVGPIIWCDGRSAVQSLGRNRAVVHDVGNINVLPGVGGGAVRIQYRSGRGEMDEQLPRPKGL